MDVKLMKSLCLLVFLSCGSLYGSSFGRRHHHHSSSNNDQLNKNAVSEYLLNDLQRDSRATTTTAANDDVPKSCPTSTILNVKKHRIIKTNESTKNGASFLDRPPHVESQDQCIAACCKTDQCNLAVFEADGEHSCYLFDCQKPSVCKFVDHDSYSTIDVEYRMIPPATPAAESKPRPPTKKPTSTKPTISDKHEDDLKMIGEKNANDERVEDEENDNDSNDDGDKKPMIDDDGDNKDAIDLPEKTAEVVSTTVMPVVATTTIRKAKSKKRPTLAAPVEEQKFVRPSCGRFQFECLNKNTEIGPTCIAQYDQCDGVEQCLDGSDEEGCDTSEYEQNFSNEVEPAKPFVDEVPNDNEEVTDAQPKTPPSRVRQQHYKPVATKTSETMSKESPSTDYSARERQHTNLMDNDDTSSSDRNSEIDEDNESQNELKQQIVEQSKSEAVHQLDRQHSSNVETPVDNNRNPADSSSDVGDRDRYQDQLSTDIGGGSYLHNDEEDGGGLNRKRPDITDDIDEPSRKPRPLPPRQFTNTDDSQMSSASRQRVQTFGKTVNALATDKNMKGNNAGNKFGRGHNRMNYGPTYHGGPDDTYYGQLPGGYKNYDSVYKNKYDYDLPLDDGQPPDRGVAGQQETFANSVLRQSYNPDKYYNMFDAGGGGSDDGVPRSGRRYQQDGGMLRNNPVTGNRFARPRLGKTKPTYHTYQDYTYDVGGGLPPPSKKPGDLDSNYYDNSYQYNPGTSMLSLWLFVAIRT